MNTKYTKILVVGGGYAGVLAALRLAGKARKRGVKVAITLVNGAPHFVERVRLHELAAGRAPRRVELTRLLRGSGVELAVGWARAIDAGARVVELADTRGGTRKLAFDHLIDASGSCVAADLPGAREHGFTVGDDQAATKLGRRLARARAGDRVIVVGGGLTAIEAASEIAEGHPHLEVVLASDRVGADLSEAGRAYLLRALDAIGVEVREGTRAVEVQPDGLLVRSVGLSVRTRLAASVVVMATGFRASPLAARSGLPTTPDGRVVVDEHLRVIGHPTVWAAGDAAAALGADGHPLRMSCATAMPQAAYAADDLLATICGEPHEPFRFGFLVRCISIGRRRGLIQWVDDRDVARESILTGRLGAWFKEAVVRFTVWSLRFERLFPGGYRWPRPAAAAPRALTAGASR